MPKRTSDHRSWLLKQLTKPIVAANYLNAAISDSPDMFLVALRNVAEAHRMAKVAGEAGVAREALYKTLSEEGNPRFDTLGAILKAVGLRIAVEAVAMPSLGRSPRLLGSIDQIDPLIKPDPSHRPSSLRGLFASLSKPAFQRFEDPALFQLTIERMQNWTTGGICIAQPLAGDSQSAQ